MAERPILFSGPMVRAILDGSKTQTRRVVKLPTDHTDWGIGLCFRGACQFNNGPSRHRSPESFSLDCPFGFPGDRLWVRETWGQMIRDGKIVYRANYPENTNSSRHVFSSSNRGWRPSIHMPKKLARVWLEVVDVRVERLQEISEADAIAEASPPAWKCGHPDCIYEGEQGMHWGPRVGFAKLWDSLNAKRAPWDSNPWVWVIDFKRIENG